MSGDVVAVFEATAEQIRAVRDDYPDRDVNPPAPGFYWQRLVERSDGSHSVEEQGGPFPVYSSAWESACTTPRNQGLEVEDWREVETADLEPVASTATVEGEARTVEAGPAEGVVPLHDEDGTVLAGHEGDPGGAPSATQEWPFEAQVREGAATGVALEGIEAPADGTPAVLDGDPSGEPGEQVRQLPAGMAVDQDGNLVWTEDAADDYEPGSLVEDVDGAPLPPADDPRFDDALEEFLVESGLRGPESPDLDDEVADQEADAAAEAERAALASDAALAAEAVEVYEHGREG